MNIRSLYKSMTDAWRKPRRAIILGAGSDEYRLCRVLERNKAFTVLFFIDEDPWNHRTKIGSAELRYPSELAALCDNYKIDTVLYCDEAKALDLPNVPCEIRHINA